MQDLKAFSIFVLSTSISVTVHYVQSALRYPLHEFARKYNKGVWLDTTPSFNDLVKHIEEQAETITVQNCSLIYENTLSALESRYMATTFIEQQAEYKAIRFKFLASYFEHDYPNATQLSHAEYSHRLYDFMQRKDLVGGEWRRACWVIFMQWLTLSDEWRNVTTDNPLFKTFVDTLQTAQVDGLTIDEFVNCIMQIWSSASNFVKTDKKVEFPKNYQKLLFTLFGIALPPDTASLCTAMLVDFK